jgi:hypothetical protein
VAEEGYWKLKAQKQALSNLPVEGTIKGGEFSRELMGPNLVVDALWFWIAQVVPLQLKIVV